MFDNKKKRSEQKARSLTRYNQTYTFDCEVPQKTGIPFFIAMAGVDLLKIQNGQIKEVWLFSEDQEAENVFWGCK